MQRKINIQMTTKQMNLIREAVEFYSRFMSGQLDAIPDELRFPVNREGRSDELREATNALKKVLFPELHFNASYGIGCGEDSVAQKRQLAYEIYRQVLVFNVAERKAQGEDVRWNVYNSAHLEIHR